MRFTNSPGFGHDPHALLVEEKVDERLRGVRPGRFVRETQIARIPEKSAGANVIERRSFESIKMDVIDVGDAYRELARCDALGGRIERFDQRWFHGGQAAHELVGPPALQRA